MYNVFDFMALRKSLKTKLHGHWEALSWKQRGVLIGYAVRKNWSAYWKYKWVCLKFINYEQVNNKSVRVIGEKV